MTTEIASRHGAAPVATGNEATAIIQDELRQLLSYDPRTGIFHWRVTRGRLARAGDVAGTPIQGRVHIKVKGRLYYAHRLAFLYMDGALPSDEVDHIDGDPSNNRWGNLRQCSHAENMQNKQVSKANKSGLLGVSKHGNAWQATIRVGKQHHHIGRFRTPEEAHQAYLEAKARIHEFNPKIDNGRASV